MKLEARHGSRPTPRASSPKANLLEHEHQNPSSCRAQVRTGSGNVATVLHRLLFSLCCCVGLLFFDLVYQVLQLATERSFSE